MKFIHTADLHLGSKMRSKFTREQAEKRKIELFDTFRRMVKYARDNCVRAILLCGDVFDEDAPATSDKNDFYQIIKDYSEIDFLYLRGNHDVGAKYSDQKLSNLRTFSNEWTYFDYGDVTICGVELDEISRQRASASLHLNKDRLNVVMLHGDVNSNGKDGIDVRAFENKNIDYAALGHIHKGSEGKIDSRGVFAYSGCLEGRSFDEVGEKGFILLETTDDGISRTFVPFASRTFREITVDVSNACGPQDMANAVASRIKFITSDCYRINLVGDVEDTVKADDVAERVKKALENKAFLVDVKDKTQVKTDIDKYKKDPTVKGEFVRCVLNDATLTREEANEIINIGLKALEGRS